MRGEEAFCLTRLDAVAAAREWVCTKGADYPGFCGAYLSGSVLETPDTAPWPETSDVDVVLVVHTFDGAASPGKFLYEGVLLEITCIDKGAFTSLREILSTHYLAFALQAQGVLADPEGWLTPLHREVSALYAKDTWVRARCASFFAAIRKAASSFDTSAPYPQRVNSWLFPTGISAFPIVAAGLRNCTVRKRYKQAREVLVQYGFEAFYPALLRQLTGQGFDPACLGAHIRELGVTFDLAAASSGPSAAYRFRKDISAAARPIAIGGSAQLLQSAHPEDAVFWMGATFARCHIILQMDAPALYVQRLRAFRRFMADIGLSRSEDYVRRFQSLLALLPEIEKTTECIVRTRASERVYPG